MRIIDRLKNDCEAVREADGHWPTTAHMTMDMLLRVMDELNLEAGANARNVGYGAPTRDVSLSPPTSIYGMDIVTIEGRGIARVLHRAAVSIRPEGRRMISISEQMSAQMEMARQIMDAQPVPIDNRFYWDGTRDAVLRSYMVPLPDEVWNESADSNTRALSGYIGGTRLRINSDNLGPGEPIVPPVRPPRWLP